MPLPTISAEALQDPRKCLVTLNERVYDVSAFLPDHPGGADLIEEFRGKDVSSTMSDAMSHDHSDAAYEMLEEFLVGVVSSSKPASLADTDETLIESSDDKELYATGMSCEEDLNVPTNIEKDYAKHQFLDLGKPLLMQILNGGFTKEFYLQQVHRPRHYAHGSAPLMPFAWMEPLSKTPWWMVPILWLPCVSYGTYLASEGLSTRYWFSIYGNLRFRALVSFWIFGIFVWTLVEYGMHRFLFHVDKWLPDNRWFLTLHFLLHGIHHYLPTDRYTIPQVKANHSLRLVMPPALFLLLAYPWYRLAHVIFPYYIALAVYSGGIFGYIGYDMTHYFLHHRKYFH
jgi:4-hydroxysphinganine ceramide fatty acyl 2-hydroxylase